MCLICKMIHPLLYHITCKSELLLLESICSYRFHEFKNTLNPDKHARIWRSKGPHLRISKLKKTMEARLYPKKKNTKLRPTSTIRIHHVESFRVFGAHNALEFRPHVHEFTIRAFFIHRKDSRTHGYSLY